MAVSDQQVSAWLKANPTATDEQIVDAMAKSGVSPAQLAKVVGVSEGEVAARVAATITPGQSVTLGDTIVQPVHDEQGLQNVLTYKAGENKTGGAYQQYTPTGEFQKTGTQQAVADPSKQILGVAAAYFIPIIGAEIAASLGTSTAVGTAIAQTAVSVAQGVPLDKAVLNAGTNLLTGSVTGTQDAKDFIGSITTDKATQNVIQNVTNSVINTVAKGGSERDILTNAVSAASGTVIGQQTGSQIIGQGAGTLLATGDPFAAATSAAGAAGSQAAKKTTTPSPEKTSFRQDLSTAEAANIAAEVARQGGASEAEIQKKVLDIIGGKTAGTDVAFLPAAIYGGIALAPELYALAGAGSAAITGGIGYLMSLVGGGAPLPASEQEKNVGKMIVELLRANPTMNTADITAEINKILPEVKPEQIQVLKQNLDNPTLIANLPEEVVITAKRPEKTDDVAKKTGANATDATSVLVDQIKKQQSDAAKADKLATPGGGGGTTGGGGGSTGGGSPAGGGGTPVGGAGSQTGLASLAGGKGITVSKTGLTGAGPGSTTGAADTLGSTTGQTGDISKTIGTTGTVGTAGKTGTLGTTGDTLTGDTTGKDTTGTTGVVGGGTGDTTGTGTTGVGTETGDGVGDGEGDGSGDGTDGGDGTGVGTGEGPGTGPGVGPGEGPGTGPGVGPGDGGGTGGDGIGDGGEGGGTVIDPINITVSPVKGTKVKPRLPTITGFKRSPLEQALTAYRPAGEIEAELGLGREDVWNEASLRLKDALGL